MQMFIKSLQLNMSLTVFDADVKTLFHCSYNNTEKNLSNQMLKLQQNSLTQINDSHWGCGKYSRFHVIPHKQIICKKFTCYAKMLHRKMQSREERYELQCIYIFIKINKATQFQVVMSLHSIKKLRQPLPYYYKPMCAPSCIHHRH